MGQDLVPGEDFEVTKTDQGYQAQPTQEFRREQATRDLEQQLEEQTGEDLSPGQDFAVEQTADGFQATWTEQGRRKASGDPNPFTPRNEANEADQNTTTQPEQQLPSRTDKDIFSGVVSGTEDALSEVAQVASGSEETRVEFQGDGSVVNQARRKAAAGKTDLTADLGVVSDVGDAASDAGDWTQKNVIKPTADVAGDVGDLIQSGAAISAANDPLARGVTPGQVARGERSAVRTDIAAKETANTPEQIKLSLIHI